MCVKCVVHVCVSVTALSYSLPQYIQKRARLTLTSAPPASAPADVTVSAALSTEQRAQIAAADTFYIATHHHQSGLDVSHRGGRSGFVRILTDREIVWPDYKGNNLFMSLGNIAVNPHCGVTFVNPEVRGTRCDAW